MISFMPCVHANVTCKRTIFHVRMQLVNANMHIWVYFRTHMRALGMHIASQVHIYKHKTSSYAFLCAEIHVSTLSCRVDKRITLMHVYIHMDACMYVQTYMRTHIHVKICQRFSSSKLVLQTVESLFAALNYCENGSVLLIGIISPKVLKCKALMMFWLQNFFPDKLASAEALASSHEVCLLNLYQTFHRMFNLCQKVHRMLNLCQNFTRTSPFPCKSTTAHMAHVYARLTSACMIA
jgi:hypothetical protein